MKIVDLYDARSELLGERPLFSVSELFHENSRLTQCAPGVSLTAQCLAVAAKGYKRYVHARTVPLPPARFAAPDVGAAMMGRQSCREYRQDATVTLDDVATLAFAAMGQVSPHGRRCAPSAGGLYPLELYVAAFHVDGLPSGLFHYDVRRHGLTQVASSANQAEFARAVFIPEAVTAAGALFALSGVFGRSKIKYGERAYRFVLLEAGHAMQNLCLAVSGTDLGICPIGGFIDDAVNDILEVDGLDEAALYLATVGPRSVP